MKNKVNVGKIVQVIGAVVDVRFDNYIPKLYEKLNVEMVDATVISLEVESYLNTGVVRTLAFSATEGLKRGMDVKSTGSTVTVPVGDKVLGRVMNVLGDPIDDKGKIEGERWSIYRKRFCCA